jgi:hypothetical protein
MYVSGRATVPAKKIFPRPGASMVFDFEAPFYFGENSYQKVMSGLQYHPFNYASEAEYADHFVIHFSPCGLSRFIETPIDELTGQMIPPEMVSVRR